MNKARMLCLLALLTWAGGAAAQGTAGDGQQLVPGPSRGLGAPKGNPVGGMVDADSTFKIIRTDASGNLIVTSSAPIQDQNGTFVSIINIASLGAVGATSADSSAVLDTHALRHLKLLLKIVPLGGGVDTSTVARIAIQIRTHLNGASDSSSVFAEYPYGSTSAGIAAAASPDSFTTGHLIKGNGVPGTALGGIAWSGEFTVQAMAVRTAHGDAITTLGHLFYYPSGIAISLDSMYGRDFWAPYLSIRIRNLSNEPCAVTAHLVGTPL